MKEKQDTKRQAKRCEILEGKGYDTAYRNVDGNPIMVLREKNIWVEVRRDGSYVPA